MTPILSMCLWVGQLQTQPIPESSVARVDADSTVLMFCHHWSALYERMQYGSVHRPSAGRVLRYISRYLREHVEVPRDTNDYFPVENYGLPDVGGKNGDGFVRRRYNFLHGNSHRGHPAHDIFIHDDNQDGLDDRNGRPVHVIAMTDGIVVAVKNDWTPLDTLRGGNYVMLFNPHRNRYYYYAHNREVVVKVGDIVKAGTRIAIVGRSGKNAAPGRSQTHLHLMVLQLTDERGEPYNYYDELVKSVKLTSPS